MILIDRLRARSFSSHPVDIGLRSEAGIAAELVRRGHHVLLPFGFNHRYDLVLDVDGEFLRAQCKTARRRGGSIVFNTESVRSNTRKATRRSYDGEIELFLVYFPETGAVYAVPIEDATSSCGTLRIEPTANGQVRGIRWARDFELPA